MFSLIEGETDKRVRLQIVQRAQGYRMLPDDRQTWQGKGNAGHGAQPGLPSARGRSSIGA